MHKKVQLGLFFLLFGLIGMVGRAQDSANGKPVEMADRLREDGKIYVVIAVLVTIFIGRKISRLEKDSK
jgi:hypothetical protein